jgi:hypothetical protein
MASEVRKLDVLIASPGDAGAARDAVEEALHEWNDHRGDVERIQLRPRRWEIASVPILGRGDPQTVINSQLVEESDIVFAIFYHRLGTATSRAASGTAEEIEHSVEAGKFVHVYFCSAEPYYGADRAQLEALAKFRRQIEQKGLIDTFESVNDLPRRVSRAVEYDLRHLKTRWKQLARVGPAEGFAVRLFGDSFSVFTVNYDADYDAFSVEYTGLGKQGKPIEEVMVVAGPKINEFSVTLDGPTSLLPNKRAWYVLPEGISIKGLFFHSYYLTVTYVNPKGIRVGEQERYAVRY